MKTVARKLQYFPCLALVLGTALSGCFSAAHARALSSNLRKVVAGNTAFALNLFGKLRTKEGNVCFSPYSISTVLAMTYGGARGETAKQMAQTLHLNLPPDELGPAFATLEAGLGMAQKQGRVQLEVANSLWPEKGFAFLPDYLTLCRKYYDTTLRPVDFIHHTEAARKTINDWVKAKTQGKIINLLGPGMVGRSTRLVLVNAIYFKGKWASQFDTRLTKHEPFRVSSEKTITTPLMRQTGNFGYAGFPNLQVLELPYAGEDLSMLVLLPRRVEGLGRLETKLTAPNLAVWLGHLRRQRVEVFLPQFTIASRFSLADTLKSLGMTDAFNGQADFSGMDGRKDLFLNQVIHKAFVKVNEDGTEAAAATAVTVFGAIAIKRPPLPVFRADHPFLFLIRDNHNGSILFLGRVINPNMGTNR